MRFINLIKKFINSNLIWRTPDQKKIMIYDKNLINYFLKYFKRKDISILETRAESINVPVILITFLKTGFKNISINYILNYIYFVKPRIVLTATDNDLRFYCLKEKSKIPIKTVALQNGQIGSRNYFENFKKKKKIDNFKLSCDYIFCSNEEIIRNYKSIINSKYVKIGSFKNNSINIKRKKKSNHILFLSQYTFPKKNTNEIFLNNKNINISHNNFYKDDISVLKKLIIFSQNKNIKLYIKLRNPNSEKEILFYKNNLKTKKINFLSSKNLNDNYQLIDKAKLVVFLDSYFGYEAFARGKKIAAFSIRGKKLKLKNANFADNRLPNKGFFWSNQCTQSDLNKLIERVLTISEKGWFRIKRKYENKIMFYNSNNNIFKKKIKKMLNS